MQPGHPVVHLKHRQPPGPQDAPALGHDAAIVGRILHDPVRVDEVERVVGERERLGVGGRDAGREALLDEILTRQRGRVVRQVEADDPGPTPGEPHHLNPRTAPHV